MPPKTPFGLVLCVCSGSPFLGVLLVGDSLFAPTSQEPGESKGARRLGPSTTQIQVQIQMMTSSIRAVGNRIRSSSQCTTDSRKGVERLERIESDSVLS
jgi:hypothetical protein